MASSDDDDDPELLLERLSPFVRHALESARSQSGSRSRSSSVNLGSSSRGGSVSREGSPGRSRGNLSGEAKAGSVAMPLPASVNEGAQAAAATAADSFAASQSAVELGEAQALLAGRLRQLGERAAALQEREAVS